MCGPSRLIRAAAVSPASTSSRRWHAGPRFGGRAPPLAPPHAAAPPPNAGKCRRRPACRRAERGKSLTGNSPCCGQCLPLPSLPGASRPLAFVSIRGREVVLALLGSLGGPAARSRQLQAPPVELRLRRALPTSSRSQSLCYRSLNLRVRVLQSCYRQVLAALALLASEPRVASAGDHRFPVASPAPAP